MNDDNRPGQNLTSDQLGDVFRSLADEYALDGASSNEATWAKIEGRSSGGAGRVASLSEHRNRRPLLWGLSLSAAAGVLALVASQGVFSGGGEALGYAVSGVRAAVSASSSEAGDLIASEEKPLVVEFTDQTKVQLQPYSTLRVSTDARSRSVTARLSQGSAQFATGEDSTAKFTFQAGVYTLRPIGAKFSFGYMPKDEQLDVSSDSGIIIVTDESGKEYRVDAGRTLRLPEGSVRVAKVVEAEPATTEDDSGVAGTEAPRDSAPPSGKVPSFAELAARGKFSEVVALAKKRGIDQMMSSASSADLQQLAQAARYTGDFALAERTWTQMTTRFGGTSGKNARFFLGRLAEQQGNTGQALQHYDQYLKGSGGGVYTAEALGRKLSIVNKSHGAQKARPIAQEYLRRFPQGPYAKTARELVGGE